MPSYHFAPSARQQIREIIATIQQDNHFAAERWLSDLHEKCRTLAGSPRAGRIRKDLLPDLYMFPFGNYLIFYDIVPGGIQVVYVIHGARDVRRASRQGQ